MDIGGTNRAPCCKDVSTKDLVKILRSVEAATPSFVLNTFFDRIVRTDKDKVEIQSQHQQQDRKLAPFVCPCVEAKPNDAMPMGWDALEITPAYIKQKDALNACHKALAQRGAFEAAGGSLTRRQRRDGHITQLLGRQSGRITRREEWMAVNGLLKGGYQVSGDRYPAQLVRMPRADDADLTACGDAIGCCNGKDVLNYRIYELCKKSNLWNNCGEDLMSQLEDIIAFGFEKFGAHYTHVLVGDNVAKALRGNKAMREMIKCAADIRSNRLGATTMDFGFQREDVDTDQRAWFIGELFVGSGLQFWRYRGTFQDLVTCDNAGNPLDRDQWYTVETPFIPPDVALFIDNSTSASGIDGTRFYGAIMDLDWDFATDGPQSRFPKRWSQPDPSCWHFMTQSAPLVLPCNANGALAICVTEGENDRLCVKPKECAWTDVPCYSETDGLMALKGYELSGRKVYDKNGAISDAEAEARVAVTPDAYAAAVEAMGGSTGSVEPPAFK